MFEARFFLFQKNKNSFVFSLDLLTINLGIGFYLQINVKVSGCKYVLQSPKICWIEEFRCCRLSSWTIFEWFTLDSNDFCCRSGVLFVCESNMCNRFFPIEWKVIADGPSFSQLVAVFFSPFISIWFYFSTLYIIH